MARSFCGVRMTPGATQLARTPGERFVCTNGTTRAPSCARRAHTTRPRFPEAPVTTTDFPARPMELLLDTGGVHQPAAAGDSRARPRVPGRARHTAVHRWRA